MASACVSGTLWPALAQTPLGTLGQIESPPEDDSVLGRSRPEYDPQGLPLGAFRAYPTLTLGAAYDDNVLRTPSDHQGDFVFEVSPTVNLRSEWVRHYFALRAGATHYRLPRLSSENRTEWDVAAGGRLDVFTGFNLTGAVSHNSTFEPRTSRDQAGAATPTPYTTSDARAAISYNPFRFGMQLGAAVRRYDYGHTELLPAFGGGERSNDDRNRDVYSMYTTALYEFSPGYGAFIRPSFEKRVYDMQTGRAAGRDSNGYRVDGGITLLLTRLVTGEAYLGYLQYDFEGPSFEDLSGIDYGAQLRWYPSELVTVHLNASRTPTATTLSGASVADDRFVEVGVDYELLRNVIVQGGLAYTNTQFDGISRQDEDFSARLGVAYLLNPYLAANFRVARTTRASSESGQGYIDNILSIALTGRL
jgi:hypothetical protein